MLFVRSNFINFEVEELTCKTFATTNFSNYHNIITLNFSLRNAVNEAIHKGFLHIFRIFFFFFSGIFQQKADSKIHIHHPYPHANTKKVSHKVKYLLTILIQNENRERINIYLNISYGNRKTKYLF